MKKYFVILGCIILPVQFLCSQASVPEWNFKVQQDNYFEHEVQKIEKSTELTNWSTAAEFYRLQSIWRQQLYDMLGLWPVPNKTPLKAIVTSTLDHGDFVVEKVRFESLPGLYVTANVYRPKKVTNPLPAILYVCGHATVVEDDYNYGAKAHYQHHPAWYARHGYICIVVDTLQLGEIEGIHHGLYRYDRWWWIARGYTPAGVEAWNGIRALDYLISRPDVDSTRLGMTGRSGGGATTWWVGALDERVKVVIPVAGITDLRDHVVNDCVEGHCDCMYFNNTYGWDFSKVAALIAPRPLLIANADSDEIFPLDGVYRTFTAVKKLYKQLQIPDLTALNIVGGGHHDVQEIQVHAFRWFNHFLQGTDSLINLATPKLLAARDLRVLQDFPADEKNTRIDSLFVSAAEPVVAQIERWGYAEAKKRWTKALQEQVFNQWPEDQNYPGVYRSFSTELNDLAAEVWHLPSDQKTDLPLIILGSKKNQGANTIYVLDDQTWATWSAYLSPLLKHSTTLPAGQQVLSQPFVQEALKDKHNLVFLPMREAGPTKTTTDTPSMTHLKRRYYLLGQTLEAMQTFDLKQGLKVIQERFSGQNNDLICSGVTGAQIVYALPESSPFRVTWHEPVITHYQGPIYPQVLKFFDLPAALAMAAEDHEIRLVANQNPDLDKVCNLLKQKVPSLRLQVHRN